MSDVPPIAFFGAGSVGCFVGGAWQAAGLPVSFVGRERTRQDVDAHGMTLTDGDGTRLHLPPGSVAFHTSPKALADAGVIALAVKSYDTEAAAKDIAKHGRKGATVISFQNGVSNVARLKALLPGFDIVQGMVPYNVAYLGSGRWHKGVAGELVAEARPVTEAIAARLGRRVGQLRTVSDVEGLAWGKLLINLNNAVNALSGKSLLEQLSDRGYRRIVAASMVETLAILGEAGIKPAKLGPIPPDLLPYAIGAPDLLFRNTILKAQRIDPHARSSMADDIAAGRRTEIDYLNGEVVKLARTVRMRAPVNEAIVSLVKQAEAGVERKWSAAELSDIVLEGRDASPAGH
ncbi:MAG: 2-dehydropantoate 2-reductase [Sphingomonadales bacterium]|jgi:2-dehydropantoate 2-reductase|nr:2-dehydropantoate 2-reductase [Sphingomonadales bacterium]